MDQLDSSLDYSDGDSLGHVLENAMDTLSSEDLKHLLTDTEAWETYVADMPRDQADTLYEALCYETGNETMEDEDVQEFRERFLKSFPQIKKQLEELIAQFQVLADKADNLRKNCTITNMVTNSTSIVSGIMIIAGLTLSPLTAGVSLALRAAGAGLGAASAVTSVSTSIVEKVKMSSIDTEAKTLSSAGNNIDSVFKEILQNAPKLVSIGNNINAMNNININSYSFKLIPSNTLPIRSNALPNAACLISAGVIAAQSAKQVQKALEGTALTVPKGTRIIGTVFAGIALVTDMYNLVKNSKELLEGAKIQSSKCLREKATELENKLAKLTEIHKSLQ